MMGSQYGVKWGTTVEWSDGGSPNDIDTTAIGTYDFSIGTSYDLGDPAPNLIKVGFDGYVGSVAQANNEYHVLYLAWATDDNWPSNFPTGGNTQSDWRTSKAADDRIREDAPMLQLINCTNFDGSATDTRFGGAGLWSPPFRPWAQYVRPVLHNMSDTTMSSTSTARVFLKPIPIELQ